jgi:hypothetical protein
VCQCRKRLARVVKQRLRLSRGQTFGAARHVATILSVRKMSCLSGRANPTRDTSHALTRKLGATKRCALRAYAPRGRCSRIVRPVNTRDPTTRRTEPRPTCAQSLMTLEEHDALGCQDRSGGGRYFKSSALSCEHAHPEARFASTIHVSSNNQAAGNTHEAVDGTVRVRTMRAQRATVLTKRTLGQFDRQRRPAGDEEAPPAPQSSLALVDAGQRPRRWGRRGSGARVTCQQAVADKWVVWSLCVRRHSGVLASTKLYDDGVGIDPNRDADEPMRMPHSQLPQVTQSTGHAAKCKALGSEAEGFAKRWWQPPVVPPPAHTKKFVFCDTRSL